MSQLLLTSYQSSCDVSYVGDITDVFSMSIHAYIGSQHCYACMQVAIYNITVSSISKVHLCCLTYIERFLMFPGMNLLLLLCINIVGIIQLKCKFILKVSSGFKRGFLQKPQKRFQIRHWGDVTTLVSQLTKLHSITKFKRGLTQGNFH